MTNNYLEYKWSDFNTDVHMLAQLIERSVIEKPQYVHGIPRGGSVVAVVVSHLLEIQYVRDMQHPLADASNTVIVDDICDTGKTLLPLMAAGFECFTIHYKSHAKTMPYHVESIPDNTWVVYPWENKKKAKQDYENFLERRKDELTTGD